MSTRGTYQVLIRKYQESNLTQCFYKHCDNYPSGAAHSFREALALEWKYQVRGKNFIKRLASLDGYEFIDSHDDHGDTEYRYNIWENEKSTHIEAFKKNWDGEGFEQWELFFDGLIEDFIKKFDN